MLPEWLFITLWVVGTIAIIAVLCAMGFGLDYYVSCHKAEIFNRLHQTAWTCSDFFWAGDQINSQTITIH